MKIFKNGNKFYLDFRFLDKRFRLIAFENENASKELGRTLARLMEIYHSNDVMPLELQRAADCMPSRIVRKLNGIGLLSRRKDSRKEQLGRPFRRLYGQFKSQTMFRAAFITCREYD